MDLGIKGKKALVTGASRGIGRSIADALADEGVTVAVVARNTSQLNEFVKLKGNGHCAFTYDLMSEGAPEKFVQEMLGDFGNPDIIVHNLGGNLGITNPLCPISDWRKSYRFNLEIAIELNSYLLPLMQKKKWGRVIHISSISSLENQGAPTYCAMKAALNAYVRSVGRYVSPDGISMSTVLPGAIFTEGGYWDQASVNRPEHVGKYLKERMAIKRFGELDEISKLVVFLSSKYAGFITGSSFLADGGQGRCFQ
ncbi:MAG TPA: SDR family oxidoreductase [bacterium]|nr:SDR family oxidoreductase [bacterium]